MSPNRSAFSSTKAKDAHHFVCATAVLVNVSNPPKTEPWREEDVPGDNSAQRKGKNSFLGLSTGLGFDLFYGRKVTKISCFKLNTLPVSLHLAEESPSFCFSGV